MKFIIQVRCRNENKLFCCKEWDTIATEETAGNAIKAVEMLLKEDYENNMLGDYAYQIIPCEENEHEENAML